MWKEKQYSKLSIRCQVIWRMSSTLCAGSVFGVLHSCKSHVRSKRSIETVQLVYNGDFFVVSYLKERKKRVKLELKYMDATWSYRGQKHFNVSTSLPKHGLQTEVSVNRALAILEFLDINGGQPRRQNTTKRRYVTPS